MHRLLHLLYWQAQFDSRRPLVWLVGAGYILVAGPILLAIFAFIRGRMGLTVSGSQYLAALTIINTIGTILWATYQASRAADERATGFLAMVQMTDISPATLTAFRALGILVSLLPLWLMRLPLYVWCYYLGSATLGDFLVAESVVCIATIFAAAVSISCSQVTRSSQAALTVIAGILVGSQMMFHFPRLFMQLARLALGPMPGVFDDVNQWAMGFSQWSLTGMVWSPPMDQGDWLLAAPAFLFHLSVAVIALLVAWRLAYVNVLPDDTPRRPPTKAGPRRRAAGDALAWQAVHLHHIRGSLRKASVAFDLILLGALLSAQFSLPPIGAGLLALMICFRSLTTAAMRAGVCLAYEIRDQTLSTLALLPRDPLDFFYSWRSGGMRASRPEYVSAAIAAPFVWWNMGDPAAGLLGVMVAMLLAAPFGYLNMLCRFEWAVFTLSLWVFPAGFACLALGLFVAAYTNPWIGLATFSLLALLFHYSIVRQIPYYFLRAVERG